MAMIEKIADVKAYQKPRDSIFSVLITRKLSRIATFFLLRWFPSVTPNTVSILSFILSSVGCLMFLSPNFHRRILGVVLLQIGFVLDCSDGEISRITNQHSKFGAWLDSSLDRLKEALMLGTMTLHWFWHIDARSSVLLLGASAIIGLQLVSYFREAKRRSWPSHQSSEFSLTKKIYIGTVDVTIFLVSFAVLFQWEIAALWLFFIASIPMIGLQFRSALRLAHTDH